MSELETSIFILEDALLDHLATPEGAMSIWKERINVDLLAKNEENGRDVLNFVLDYIDRHRIPPTQAIIGDETGLYEFQEPEVPVEYVIEKLRDRYRRKSLKEILTKTARMVDSDPTEAIKFSAGEFRELQSKLTSHKDELDTWNSGLVMERYTSRELDQTVGASIGYEELDEQFGGMNLGELSFVIGRPGTYKSWQLIKSAAEALQQDRNVDLFTLEMTAQEMQDRLVCMLAGVSWTKFNHKALMPADKALFAEANDWLRDCPYRVRIVNPPAGERTVAHMRQQALEHEASVVYIDQLSFIESVHDKWEKWERVSNIVYELKEAASDFPILCAAQFNRAAMGIKEMGDLEHIGLSDSIGQAADMVLALYASREMKEQKLLHYGTIKSRKFENVVWEVKVDLTDRSNFRVISVVEDDA